MLEAAQVDVVDVGLGLSSEDEVVKGEPAIITGSAVIDSNLHSIYVVKQIFAPKSSSKLFMAKSA